MPTPRRVRCARVLQERKGCGAHHQAAKELFRAALRFARVPQKNALLAIAGLAAATLVFAAGRVDLNNPTGTHGLIVVDKIGRHIRFLDPSNFQEISNLEVGVAPHDLAISPDHKFAYITVYGDGVYGRNPHPGHTIAIIDLASHKVTGTITSRPIKPRTESRSMTQARSTSRAISAASCW